MSKLETVRSLPSASAQSQQIEALAAEIAAARLALASLPDGIAASVSEKLEPLAAVAMDAAAMRSQIDSLAAAQRATLESILGRVDVAMRQNVALVSKSATEIAAAPETLRDQLVTIRSAAANFASIPDKWDSTATASAKKLATSAAELEMAAVDLRDATAAIRPAGWHWMALILAVIVGASSGAMTWKLGTRNSNVPAQPSAASAEQIKKAAAFDAALREGNPRVREFLTNKWAEQEK